MKRLNYYLSGLLFFGISLFSCQKETLDKKFTTLNDLSLQKKLPGEIRANTFYGPQVQVGDGKVRTFFSVTHLGVPQEIGIEMSRTTLNSLPGQEIMTLLPLHPKAVELTPFNHISFDWYPQGHQPSFYQVPHFDIRFYFISNAERMQIPAYSAATAPLFENYPPWEYIKIADFFWQPDPGGEAMVGKNWTPHYPIYRPFWEADMGFVTYNGALIAEQPMITLEYLLSAADFSRSFPQPEKFAEAGYYPTYFNLRTDPDTNTKYISLSNFVWRNAN